MITRSVSSSSRTFTPPLPKATTRKPSIIKDQGTIRLYAADGKRSTVATLTSSTTATEISENYKVDALYVQIGNAQIRPLPPDSRPLFIISEHMKELGFTDFDVKAFGADQCLRSIIAFFLGRPILLPNSGIRSEILVAECDVRRGKLVHKWQKARCMLYNGTVRIQKDAMEDELIPLIQLKISLCDTKRGRALRLQDNFQTTVLHFDQEDTLHLWLNRCQQLVQSSSYDLSDQRLTLLPEVLFVAGDAVKTLNLRRNSLAVKVEEEGAPLVGWIDDLSRLQNLTSLDLSSNQLPSFPLCLTELILLGQLNLSSNRIPFVSPSIKRLKRLHFLDISNNWISQLPPQFVECISLTYLNLSFNRFKHVPQVLTRLDLVKDWNLAGNYIERIDDLSDSIEHLRKIDLRRNELMATFCLPVGSYEHLAHIDIRDNQNVSAVNLMNAPSVQTVLCSRLQLSAIHINGRSLTHLFVDHNLLDSLVIMPIPTQLQVLDVAHNLFESLPDWICDVPLTALRSNHNRLQSLPNRIFCMPSLHLLACHNNDIRGVPSTFNESGLETVLLQNNEIEQLPADFFRALSRLRQLNISFNHLRHLPFPSTTYDWNRIQILRLAGNELDESVIPQIVMMKKLKVLDLHSNQLKYFDDSALQSLTLLDDLNISSNQIASISAALPNLPALASFRAHSNAIRSVPDFSETSHLQVLDFSNNQLIHFTPFHSSDSQLRHLDVSCNASLQFNTGTIGRQRRRRVAVVDIANENRGFRVGNSESTGLRNKLCIRQFQNGNVIGMIDGGMNYDLPKRLTALMREQLEGERNSDLSKLLLTSHLKLGELGERLGASVCLLRLGQTIELATSGTIGIAIYAEGNLTVWETGNHLDENDYMRLRQHGLIVDENNLINGVLQCPRHLGMYYLNPATGPRPHVKKLPLKGIDCIVMANRALWDHLTAAQISSIVGNTLNPRIAAKRLQDAVQSCDFTENLSIIVIRLPKPELRFSKEDEKVNNKHETIDKRPLNFENSVEAIKASFERLHPVGISRERQEEPLQTGRSLYGRILADELANRPTSASSTPPDPQVDELPMAPALPKSSPPSTPTPLPRHTPSPPSYEAYRELKKYALGFATESEGKYNVLEYTRKHRNKIGDDQQDERPAIPSPSRTERTESIDLSDSRQMSPTSISIYSARDLVSPRRLTVIRETSEISETELTMDEPTHFSLHSQEHRLTPMEESLSTRYRFEYSRRTEDYPSNHS